jgi:hypothetical protein
MNIKIAELLPNSLERLNAGQIVNVWEEAYTIDKKAALQMLLYIRDKNNGA